jgi:hypothetical protein
MYSCLNYGPTGNRPPTAEAFSTPIAIRRNSGFYA